MALATYSDFQTRTANGRNTMSWSNTQDRQAPFPIEKYSIFPNYATARAYAAGEGEYDGLPYEGQVVSVTEGEKQVIYVLDHTAPDNLRKVGSDIDVSTLEPSDIGAADAEHTHEISDVTGLQNALNDKADDEHEHEISDVNNLETRLENMAAAIASGGGGGEASIPYTVNGTFADSNGNFTVNPNIIGAALNEHTHELSEINGLINSLDGKADIDHTHTMVNHITVNGVEVTGDVELVGRQNIDINQQNNTLTFDIMPYETDIANSINVSNSIGTLNDYKLFIGTQAEWNEFKANNTAINTRYIVFLRS